MFNTHYVYGTVIGLSAMVASLVGPLALFELAQPGHSVNKYYEELHPSSIELAQLDFATTRTAPVSAKSELAEAPTIVIPTGLIVAIPQR